MSVRLQRADLAELVSTAEDGISIWLARAILNLTASEFATLTVDAGRRYYRLQSSRWLLLPGFSRPARGKAHSHSGVKHTAEFIQRVVDHFYLKTNEWCTYEEVSEFAKFSKYAEVLAGTELPFFLAPTLEGQEPPPLTFQAVIRCFGGFEHSDSDPGKFRLSGRTALPLQAAADIRQELSKATDLEEYVTVSQLGAQLQWDKTYASALGPLDEFLALDPACQSLGLDWGVRAACSASNPREPDGPSARVRKEMEVLREVCTFLRIQPGKQAAVFPTLSHVDWDSLGWGSFVAFAGSKWRRWIRIDQNRVTLVEEPPAAEAEGTEASVTSSTSDPTSSSLPSVSASAAASLEEESLNPEPVTPGETSNTNGAEEEKDPPADDDSPPANEGERVDAEEEAESPEDLVPDAPAVEQEHTPTLWTLFEGKV
eukprot:RCo035498